MNELDLRYTKTGTGTNLTLTVEPDSIEDHHEKDTKQL